MPGGGNFDLKLKIDEKGDIHPTGDLGGLADPGRPAIADGKVHLHFWVTQQHSGTPEGGTLGAFMQGQAMQQEGNTARWVTRTPDTTPKVDPNTLEPVIDPKTSKPAELELIHRHGPFKVGSAFAQAVAIVDPNELIWWATTILLEKDEK